MSAGGPSTPAELADWSVGGLLDAVAGEQPAPGAGTSAALTCALAAALTEMAAAFTVGRERHAAVEPRMREIRARAEQVRGRALELAELELQSYGPVLEALRLSNEDPGRQARLSAALAGASEAPLQTAALAGEIAELAAEAARDGNHHLRGEALAGVALAEAAAVAAKRLVALNSERSD